MYQTADQRLADLANDVSKRILPEYQQSSSGDFGSQAIQRALDAAAAAIDNRSPTAIQVALAQLERIRNKHDATIS